MVIVPQSTNLLNAPFPPLLLPAPRARLALPAPRIAGLLPAGQPRIEVINDPFDLDALFGGYHFRTREELDAELEALAQESWQRIREVLASIEMRGTP